MGCVRAACVSVVVGTLLSSAGSALAQGELVTFSFSDLSASFVDGATMQDRVFRAQAVSTDTLRTGGDVSRVDTVPTRTATFRTGFSAFPPANVSIEMFVDTTIIAGGGGAQSLTGNGSFTITDADGDTISGMIAGTWTDLGFGFDSFQGLITSAALTPRFGGDNLNFNGPGPDAGMFPYAGLPLHDLTGAFVQLQLTAGTFFNANFAHVSSQASGILVPAPAGAMALGLGGLLAARRRRR